MSLTALTDAPLTVWRGNYHFGRRDQFFKRLVGFARDYADKEPGSRPSRALFLEEMDSLRAIAPVNGLGLLDQIAYRWAHPRCSQALYAITCTLLAPPGGALVAHSGELVPELPCIKVGRAKRCVAARITTYNTEPINGLWPAEGSPRLRVLIYGDGPKMLPEKAIKDVGKLSGSPARVIDEPGAPARDVSPEVFVGRRVIDAICACARQQALA